MNQLVLTASIALAAIGANAGVYDDVSYLYRGLYDHQGRNDGIVDDYEFYNALLSADGNSDDESHKGSVGGERRYVRIANEDAVNPLTGRILKNRAMLDFLQPTYKNPGDDTLYGYSNHLGFRAPFSSEYSNDYTILVRYKHSGKICTESTKSSLFNFGFGWGANCGLFVSLMGDDDNQYPYAFFGQTLEAHFTDTQSRPEYRLSAGKWTDLVITRSRDGTMAIYTVAEGGKICKQTRGGMSVVSSDNPRDFYIGCGDGVPFCAETNTPAASSSVSSNFRGVIQKVALWNRRLTDAEVEEAMSDGFAKGDAFRLGVANDSAKEFTGMNYLLPVAAPSTSTDMDQSTDWRHFPHTLTTESPMATVRFTVGADGFLCNRRMNIRLTSASASAATLSVMLNGKALVTDGAAEPGTILTEVVSASLLKIGDNELTVTRTDAGADPVLIDFVNIVAEAAVDPGDYRGAKIADDVYAKAWAWWKRPRDLNGNGQPDDNSAELPNALYARDDLADHSIHKWRYDGHPWAIWIQTQSVTCPASGIVLNDEPCLYFDAPQWSGQYGTADLYKEVFAITNTGNYAFATRIKLREWIAVSGKETEAQVFGVGWDWTNDTGMYLSLKGGVDDGENLYLLTASGRNFTEWKKTQSLDVADRLCAGKWIDIAVSVSNGYQRIYTFVEGGTQLVEHGPIAVGGAIPESSTLTLGLGNTSGTSGSGGDVPPQFRGWMHSSALWPCALNRDEVLLAFKYPHRPNLVTVGVADGTRREFNGNPVGTWTPPANGDYAAATPNDLYFGTDYTVNFTIPAEQANRNQLFRLSATENSDPTAQISLELNGETIVNYPQGGGAGTSVFSADANGVYEIGVRRELIKAGASTLTVRYASGNAPISIDALLLGNGDRSVRVPSGKGFSIIFR